MTALLEDVLLLLDGVELLELVVADDVVELPVLLLVPLDEAGAVLVVPPVAPPVVAVSDGDEPVDTVADVVGLVVVPPVATTTPEVQPAISRPAAMIAAMRPATGRFPVSMAAPSVRGVRITDLL